MAIRKLHVPSKNDDYRNLSDEMILKETQIVNEIRQVFGKDNQMAVIAILANMYHETGGSLDFKQKQNEGGPGRGLLQFEGYHLQNYNRYLTANNKPNSSLSQIEYLYESIYDDDSMVHDFFDRNKDGVADFNDGNFPKGWRNEIKEAWEVNNPWNATQVFSDVFLRPGIPHMQRRLDYAGNIFNVYSNRSINDFDNLNLLPEQKALKMNEYVDIVKRAQQRQYLDYEERYDSNNDGVINIKDDKRPKPLNPDNYDATLRYNTIRNN